MQDQPTDRCRVTRRTLLGGAGLGWLLAGCDREGGGDRGERSGKPAVKPVDPFAFACTWEHRADLAVGEAADMVVTAKDEVLALVGRTLTLWSAGGDKIRSWACAFEGRALAGAEGGGCWVAGAAQVAHHDSRGRPVTRWTLAAPEGGRKPLVTGLARVGSNLLFADAANRCVHRYAINGDFINRVGDEATPRGLVIPSPYFEVCAGAEETLWLGHTGRHKVCRYQLDGTLISGWGRQGMGPGRFAGCCNPVGLFACPDGRMLTAEKGLGRVTLYTAGGKPVSLVGPGLISRESRRLRVAMDGAGRVLVSDPAAGRIRIFRSKVG